MTISYRFYAVLISVVLSILALSTVPAHANHPTYDESATPSQVQSIDIPHEEDAEVHHTSVPTAVTISAPVGSTAQLQQLLAVMLQLVELLQKQQEIIAHDETPHVHDEDEDHDDEQTNEEDHA